MAVTDAKVEMVSEAVRELLERLEMSHLPSPNPEEQWYSYIPLPLGKFLDGLFMAREALGPGAHRWLEIGSGIGSKLCLAHSLGWQAEGIELHEGYVVQSRRLFPFCPVTQTDASTFDGYDQFDVVYGYRVATHWKEQDTINRRISSLMRPGALFFCPSFQGPYPEWLEHIDGHLWRIP